LEDCHWVILEDFHWKIFIGSKVGSYRGKSTLGAETNVLLGYTDSDFAGDREDKKKISRWKYLLRMRRTDRLKIEETASCNIGHRSGIRCLF